MQTVNTDIVTIDCQTYFTTLERLRCTDLQCMHRGDWKHEFHTCKDESSWTAGGNEYD